MFIHHNLFFILLTTIVQSQNVTVQFQTFPSDTDIGSCTCDLTANQCDVSCCCDPDCSAGDQEVFECSSRANQYTNSTPIISTVQPTCIKNISIFYSNSPYIIQKMGELVCVDYDRYQGSQYYQQPVIQTLDPVAFVQAIDTDYSVSAPLSLPTNLTNYQVGTPILTYNASTNTSYYSLPVNLFNNELCSGSRLITYMNNFTSTCSQIVDSDTCTAALNPATYINSLCFIQSPSNLNSISNRTCDNTTASSASFAGITCSGALESLIVTIYYENPTGIVYTNLTYTTANPTNTELFEQTFTVQFIQISVPSSTNATRNPGYLQGTNIIAANGNSSTINILSSSQFSISKPLSNGGCDQSSVRTDYTPINFGENIRSTCIYTTSSTTNCSGLPTLYIPNNSRNLYVAAYSNPNEMNITSDWLPVIFCASTIGAPTQYQCNNDILTNTLFSQLCFIKLDIEIDYTNIGSIFNPQPVLSAVIFNYQGISNSSTLPTTLLVMESVTFHDISNAPVIEQGQIPAPNTRLPADFFYPFSSNQGTKSMTFSLVFHLLITVFFILM